eukprot:7532317-Prorocentrum_lima.AAC.1
MCIRDSIIVLRLCLTPMLHLRNVPLLLASEDWQEKVTCGEPMKYRISAVSYTHLRAHETRRHL